MDSEQGRIGLRIGETLEETARNLAADAKKAGEVSLTHEGLWAALSESREIARLSNWLLAFQGAAAAIVLANSSETLRLFGETATTAALMVLGLGALAGIGAKWLNYRIEAQRSFRSAVREATDPIQRSHSTTGSSMNKLVLEEILDSYGEDSEETDSLREFQQYMQDTELDVEAAWKAGSEEYARTLSPFGRWRSKRSRPPADDQHWLPRRFLRLQHWQFRLTLLQLLLVVVLLVGAVFSLASTRSARLVPEQLKAPSQTSSTSSESRAAEDSKPGPAK